MASEGAIVLGDIYRQFWDIWEGGLRTEDWRLESRGQRTEVRGTKAKSRKLKVES